MRRNLDDATGGTKSEDGDRKPSENLRPTPAEDGIGVCQMTTLTTTQARQNWFALLKKSIKRCSPVRISSQVGNVVLISRVHYESLLGTLELLSTPGMLKSIKEAREDIKAGRTKSLKRSEAK